MSTLEKDHAGGSVLDRQAGWADTRIGSVCSQQWEASAAGRMSVHAGRQQDGNPAHWADMGADSVQHNCWTDRQGGGQTWGADRVQHVAWADRRTQEQPQRVHAGGLTSGMYWNLTVATGDHLAWSLPVPLRALARRRSSWPLPTFTMVWPCTAQRPLCYTALVWQSQGTSALLAAVGAGCMLPPSLAPWGSQRRLPLTGGCH